jgi:hypothetical protein
VRSARAHAAGCTDSARAYAHYQVAEPRQMCWLPYIADMTTPALKFAGRGLLAAQQIHSPSPPHKPRVFTYATGSARDQNHREAEIAEHDH